MRVYNRILFFVLCSFAPVPMFAQLEPDEGFIDRLSFPVAGWKTLVLPFVGYEPVTGIAGGITVLNTKRLSKDTTLPFSFSEFDMVYTQNHQFFIEDEVFLYLGKKYLIKGYVVFAKYPDKYWGVGNETTADMLQHYNSTRWYANMHFLRRINSKLYLGLKYRAYSMSHITTDATDPNTISNITGANGGLSSGLGYSLVWDSRDNILNPHKGRYINVAHAFFNKFTLSDFSFSRFEFDARQYFNVYKEHVLALQFNTVFSAGNVPFPMMALLGSESEMRGYYRGRYRDMDYVATQVEYRLPLFWRIGMVGFAGLGKVYHRVEDFDFNNLKYSLGGGLRLMANKKSKVNLRVDYAVGYLSDGLYIYLAEAF